MAGFGVRMIAVVHHPETTPGEPGVTFVTLDQLLRESDIVSIHLPLTPETKGLIGEAALRQMKPTAILVNTGRGLIVDQDALVRALQEKRLAGAALDVMAQEPLPPTSPLAALDNVILTPHYGGVSEESELDLHERTAQSVEALLRGEWPPFPVNRPARRR
jgi:phosphoglycerate dehydrogenase-like enzyme